MERMTVFKSSPYANSEKEPGSCKAQRDFARAGCVTKRHSQNNMLRRCYLEHRGAVDARRWLQQQPEWVSGGAGSQGTGCAPQATKPPPAARYRGKGSSVTWEAPLRPKITEELRVGRCKTCGNRKSRGVSSRRPALAWREAAAPTNPAAGPGPQLLQERAHEPLQRPATARWRTPLWLNDVRERRGPAAACNPI